MAPTNAPVARCFVSHSYRDQAALEACLAQPFPDGLAPFVFPPMTVTPDQAVSAHLVDALRSSDALAYLATPVSTGSFWVGFERNMAARLGKPVFAFAPDMDRAPFTLNASPPIDPIVSILFNLCVADDVETIARIRDMIWDRYRFEIRGDQWRRLDNEPRQMFDSIEGMSAKVAAGGVALVFLSNASVCDSHHDYADPSTYRRAVKDMESPVGYSAAKFRRLDLSRTLVVWLDSPDRLRIDPALASFPADWQPFVEVVRRSLDDPHKLVVVRSDGKLDLNHLDTLLARCFWAAREADPRFAAEFRASLTKRS